MGFGGCEQGLRERVRGKSDGLGGLDLDDRRGREKPPSRAKAIDFVYIPLRTTTMQGMGEYARQEGPCER